LPVGTLSLVQAAGAPLYALEGGELRRKDATDAATGAVRQPWGVTPEGGYEAKALGYSIHTQAETLDELRAPVQDAVRCHFDEAERPSLVRLHVVRDEVIPA